MSSFDLSPASSNANPIDWAKFLSEFQLLAMRHQIPDQVSERAVVLFQAVRNQQAEVPQGFALGQTVQEKPNRLEVRLSSFKMQF